MSIDFDSDYRMRKSERGKEIRENAPSTLGRVEAIYDDLCAVLLVDLHRSEYRGPCARRIRRLLETSEFKQIHPG